MRFVSDTEVVRVLRGFNPWWSGGQEGGSLPRFRRPAFAMSRKYLQDKALRRAVLLAGPRRVGKTTILQQLAQDGVGYKAEAILYVSLDHPVFKLIPMRDILDIYHERIYPVGQPGLLLLDEVQYAADWELEIKQLVDHHPDYRILATGSVNTTRGSDSGAGRWITIPVPPLSFYEFVQIREESVSWDELRLRQLSTMTVAQLSEVAAQLHPLRTLFQHYLLVGGFPETAQRKDEEFMLCQRLLREDVVDRVLKRDMTALFGVRNVNELERLFIYLCLHTGGIVAHNTCANALEVSAATVTRYLGFLEQAGLVYKLPPYAMGGKGSMKPRNKYYLVDAALRNAVLLRDKSVLDNAQEMGMIVETTVLRHLYTHYHESLAGIAYWRDARTNREVDIVVRTADRVLPVEIKYQENPQPGKGLDDYCAKENPQQFFLITKNDRDFEVHASGLHRIPAHILCYLLG